MPIGGGYSLVARVDYYWQDKMWGRIFNDPSDAISAWDVTNALDHVQRARQGMVRAGLHPEHLRQHERDRHLPDKFDLGSVYRTRSTAIRGPYGIRVGAHF